MLLRRRGYSAVTHQGAAHCSLFYLIIAIFLRYPGLAEAVETKWINRVVDGAVRLRKPGEDRFPPRSRLKIRSPPRPICKIFLQVRTFSFRCCLVSGAT